MALSWAAIPQVMRKRLVRWLIPTERPPVHAFLDYDAGSWTALTKITACCGASDRLPRQASTLGSVTLTREDGRR